MKEKFLIDYYSIISGGFEICLSVYLLFIRLLILCLFVVCLHGMFIYLFIHFTDVSLIQSMRFSII